MIKEEIDNWNSGEKTLTRNSAFKLFGRNTNQRKILLNLSQTRLLLPIFHIFTFFNGFFSFLIYFYPSFILESEADIDLHASFPPPQYVNFVSWDKSSHRLNNFVLFLLHHHHPPQICNFCGKSCWKRSTKLGQNMKGRSTQIFIFWPPTQP